jgi:hypothetical protein
VIIKTLLRELRHRSQILFQDLGFLGDFFLSALQAALSHVYPEMGQGLEMLKVRFEDWLTDQTFGFKKLSMTDPERWHSLETELAPVMDQINNLFYRQDIQLPEVVILPFLINLFASSAQNLEWVETVGVFYIGDKVYISNSFWDQHKDNLPLLKAILAHEILEMAGMPHREAVRWTEYFSGYSQAQCIQALNIPIQVILDLSAQAISSGYQAEAADLLANYMGTNQVKTLLIDASALTRLGTMLDELSGNQALPLNLRILLYLNQRNFRHSEIEHTYFELLKKMEAIKGKNTSELKYSLPRDYANELEALKFDQTEVTWDKFQNPQLLAGRYEIIRSLAVTSFFIPYIARDLRTDRIVVIKSEPLRNGMHFLKEYIWGWEAYLWGLAPRPLDQGFFINTNDQKQYFWVMEYAGHSLEQRMSSF